MCTVQMQCSKKDTQVNKNTSHCAPNNSFIMTRFYRVLSVVYTSLINDMSIQLMRCRQIGTLIFLSPTFVAVPTINNQLLLLICINHISASNFFLKLLVVYLYLLLQPYFIGKHICIVVFLLKALLYAR